MIKALQSHTKTISITGLVLLALLAGCASSAGNKKLTTSRVDNSELNVESTRLSGDEDAGMDGLDGEKSAIPPSSDVVVDVLKGDELVLQSGWVVRLLSIDSPTADYGKRQGNFYGKAAIEYLKSRVLGKKVTLEFDVQKTDPYGRALAYVSDATGSLNKALAEKGFALAVCFPPNLAHCAEFSKAAREAIRDKRGLWDFDAEKWEKDGTDKKNRKTVQVFVSEVLDGDTIKLEDGTIIRYIGIDAPESEAVWKKRAYGNAAYKRNRQLVENKEVSLEYDVEFRDPRGRDLAYIWVDGKMVNETLVEEGFAWVAVFPPNLRYIKRMFEAQERAATAQKGIWNTQ